MLRLTLTANWYRTWQRIKDWAWFMTPSFPALSAAVDGGEGSTLTSFLLPTELPGAATRFWWNQYHVPNIDPLEWKWMQLSPCKPYLSGDDSTWRRQTGSSSHISSMQPWLTSPPQPNYITSSGRPYENSPERTYIVGVEGTTSKAWHPSPSNWSNTTEWNTKMIPSQIAPSHSGRNWWAPSQRNGVKHGRPLSNQHTWPTTARRRGPRYASSVTTHASGISIATPLWTKWHTNSYVTEEYRTDNRKYALTDSGTQTTRDSRERLLQVNSTSPSEYWKMAEHPTWMTYKRSWSSSLDPRHATGYFFFQQLYRD